MLEFRMASSKIKVRNALTKLIRRRDGALHLDSQRADDLINFTPHLSHGGVDLPFHIGPKLAWIHSSWTLSRAGKPRAERAGRGRPRSP
jgi:hypothetical protein